MVQVDFKVTAVDLVEWTQRKLGVTGTAVGGFDGSVRIMRKTWPNILRSPEQVVNGACTGVDNRLSWHSVVAC